MWTTQRLPATDSTPVMSSSTPSPSPPPTSPSQSVIRIATLNVWSLRHKYVQVSDLITAAELDIIAVTESWHSTSEDVAVRRAAPPGFSFIDRPRSQVGLHETDVNGPRGGIVVYYRSHLTAKKIDIRIVPTTFEAVAISLSTRRGPVTLFAIYRPGSSSPSLAFFHELSAILEQFAMYNSQLVITGDFNLHLENPLLHETVEFAVVLNQFGLKQHVSESTHKCGGWVDVMVTRYDCQVVDIHVQPPVLSDHGLVVATIPFIHQPAPYITRQIRHWKGLDRDAFADALRDHPLFSNIEATPALTVTQLFDSCSIVTSELLDAFLPARTVKSRHCPLTPWFDAECRLRRRQARRLERVFRRTQLASDKTTWIHFVRNMHDFYRRREQNYWETLIDRRSKDNKRLWTTFNGLLGRRSRTRCEQRSIPFTADAFLEKITAKISSIRNATATAPPPHQPSSILPPRSHKA